VITIEISPEFRRICKPAIPKKAANATLSHQGKTSTDLTLVLTGDDEIRALNRTYLGKDAPTDVLSFSSDEKNPENGWNYVGDIIISIPRAEAQAEAAGHLLAEEISLLVIHGILHLLGYDHAEMDEKEQMWTMQAEVLQTLGFSSSIMNE
jgi:probable rRNA maturation factor